MADEAIDLAYAIESLRRQLSKAVATGTGKGLTFDVDDIELEFAIGVEKTEGEQAGLNFSLLGTGGKYGADEASTTSHRHTIKLRLKPNGANGPLKVSNMGKMPTD